MVESRSTITIDGQDYYIVPGSFVEGAVRRQAEFAYLGEEDLKSRPDTREFLHTSWTGGSQWEKPIYSERNMDTYFEANDLSMTDRLGAVQQSRRRAGVDSDLTSPSAKLAAWAEDGVNGAITFASTDGNSWQWYDWDGGATPWTATALTTTHTGGACMAIAPGSDGRVYALMDSGEISWYDPTAGTNGNITTKTGAAYNGSAIWASRDFVWVWDGDKLFNYDISDSYAESLAAIADDDYGLDVLSNAGVWTGKPIIPEWSCTRAIDTSEGIFFVKNVFEGGLTVAKIYRVDKDSSGSYILTPIGTLPKGQVAIDMTHHLGSLLISTLPNFWNTTNNAVDQRVTIYHVTGNSIGAIGSPLGGTNLDETPVWFLGAANEQLYFGGRKRYWQYDARVGAFHTVRTQEDDKYLLHGSGYTSMASVDVTNGPALLIWHTGQDGTSETPRMQYVEENTWLTTSFDDAELISNWFDFDLPMETKTIHEVYYDMGDLRTDSTITIQVSADGGAFSTVATLTGGVSVDTARVAVATPITGYKFQYKLIFSLDTVTSQAEPSRLYAVGFAAYAGEMVDVLQFTIDGDESCNYENSVQVPEDVYDNMATLRANREEVIVVHSYRQLESGTDVTNTYRVMNVTGRKESPRDGLYEVQLVEVP